jgi:hypothetical protein
MESKTESKPLSIFSSSDSQFQLFLYPFKFFKINFSCFYPYFNRFLQFQLKLATLPRPRQHRLVAGARVRRSRQSRRGGELNQSGERINRSGERINRSGERINRSGELENRFGIFGRLRNRFLLVSGCARGRAHLPRSPLEFPRQQAWTEGLLLHG